MMLSRMLYSPFSALFSCAALVLIVLASLAAGFSGVRGCGVQAQLTEYATAGFIVGEHAFDGFTERRCVTQRTFEGHQRVAQFHQLFQLRHLLDQTGRVE